MVARKDQLAVFKEDQEYFDKAVTATCVVVAGPILEQETENYKYYNVSDLSADKIFELGQAFSLNKIEAKRDFRDMENVQGVIAHQKHYYFDVMKNGSYRITSLDVTLKEFKENEAELAIAFYCKKVWGY